MNMKAEAGVLLLLMLVGPLVPNTGALSLEEVDDSRLSFYVYGAYWCPSCKKVKEGILENFGSGSMVYYELEGNEHNRRLFSELHEMTGISGIPVTGIFHEEKLYAVIEGAFDVSKTEEIIVEAEHSDGVLLFMGGKAYLVKGEDAKRLEEIFLSGHSGGENAAQSPERTSSTPSNSVCGPGLLLLVPLAVLVKRRL
ncbi:thioredoxin family protein [Thermococcus sp. ES12]|uniref:thioredoxin family protein n=1 Tax=Thermococcus sp. ES12 TaxID=1638246 RepID=UPI001431D2CD|nr:thioredoxin family protein [Thermococcus sp. ES12]NJE76157.1 thioredoxin [Thermococcus sp. ES12]